MTGVVPIIPRFRFNDSAGNPLSGGSVTVYLAGTTTLASTYQDQGLTIANTNPVTLDANGECLFWVDSAKTYKFLLKDSAGVTLTGWPVDNIPGTADIGSAVVAAADWAIKTDAPVSGTDFSAKEYAQGTQAATGGSAKNWAQQTGTDVTGAAANSRSAKSWAQDGLTGATLGGSAKDWAQSAVAPDGVNKSAKSYAADAATSAASAQSYASAALANGHIYGSTGAAQGDGTLANGSYYLVPQNSPSNTFYDLYIKVSGVASTYVNSFPSIALVGTINAAVTSAVVTYGSTANTANYPANTNYHGIRATGPGVIKNINVNVSASGTGQILVARRVKLGNLTHQVESITTVSVPASGVNVLPVSITVSKGDLVMFAMTAGGGVCFQALGSQGGILISAPIVGTQFNAPTAFTTNQPSISYDLVQNTRANAVDTTVKTLKSGTGESFAPTTQTFGDVSVGAGSPTGTAVSRGATAECPAGLLTEVQWRTLTTSRMIDANIVIWSPNSDNTTGFTCSQVIPVSVLTDSGGLAIATADDLGPVLVPEGSYVHVMGFDNNTGPVTYTADARGGTSSGTSNISVGTAATVSWFNVAYAIQFTVTLSDALTLSARVDAIDSFKSNVSSALGTENLKVGYMSGTFDGTSYTQMGGFTIPRDGTITQYSIDLTAPGTGVLLYLKKINSNRYRIASSTAYNAASSGINAFTGLSIAAKAGDVLAVLAQTGGFLRHNSNTGIALGFAYETPTLGGLCRVASPFNPSLYFTLSTPRMGLLDAVNKGGRLLYQPFNGTIFPSDWTTHGSTWTASNGITPSGVPGYGNYAIWNQGTSLSRRTNAVRVTINDTAGACGMLFLSNAGGTVIAVDGTAGQLQIRDWTPSFTSTLRKSVALPAALTAGRDYIVSTKKDGLNLTATFYDTVTQQTVSVSATITDGYAPCNGFPGAVWISGTVAPVFKWVSMDAPLKRWEARTLVIGDSNAEGSNATLAGATPWPVQLQNNAAAGDVILANQSGETADFGYRMFTDLQRWFPRYVVLALGTNDTAAGLNAWRMRISYDIEVIESLGAEPILCTIIPKTGTSVPASMNADIKGGYFGSYRYIDLASALSTGHDGVTLNASLYVGDGLHMNAAGQNAAYAQVLADAPFLLW